MEKRLVATGWLSLFAEGFVDNTRGPLLVLVLDTFPVSHAMGSLLLGAGSIAGLPGSLAAGALIGRIGPRATLRIMATLLAAGLVLIALAGALGQFPLVPLGAGVMGIGLAGVGVLSNYYVAIATPPGKRASGLAWLHVLYPMASLSVPLFVTRASEHWHWPEVTAAVALLPGLLVPFSIFVPYVAPPARSPVEASPAKEATPGSARAIAFYSTVLSLFVVAEVGVSSWLLVFAKETTTLEPMQRAWFLSAFFVGMGLVRGLGGALLRGGSSRALVVVAGLASATAVLLGLHVHIVFLSLEGLTVGLIFPAVMAELTLELPAELHGKAIGWASAAYSTALFLAHTFVGRASDLWSIRAALHLSPACAVAGVVLLLARKRVGKG